MAQIPYNAVTQQLQELGLSEHEAEIYLIVLQKGEAPAGTILDELKLHREQVYRALKRLVDNGLLTHYTKRKRGYYSAVDPRTLVSKMQAKIDIAESLQPYLKELHLKKPQVIRVGEGAESYRSFFEDIIAKLQPHEEYLVISGFGNSFYEITKDFFPKYSKIMMRKKIECRLVSYEGEGFERQFAVQPFLKVRVIPGTYAAPVATVVYGSTVAIQIQDSENLAIITIENANVADGYRQTFETLWQLGRDLTA